MQTPSRTCNVLLGTPGGDGRDGAPPDPAGTVALSTAYGDRPGSGKSVGTLLVDGLDHPEHVGVASAEALGDGVGGLAIKCGEVEAAGEVI